MFSTIKLAAFIVATTFAAGAQAETHTVTFKNSCGKGVPTLKANGTTLSTGENHTSNGALESAIAYLDTGCGSNGQGCSMVETTLVNPTKAPGSGSSTDITLIPPHAFSVTTGFRYFNGCDGTGAECANANCKTSFHNSNQTYVQVGCQADNVNLAITFCE